MCVWGRGICVCVCYLAVSLLFEGFGDERGATLDDRHIFYPPALWQLGVRGDLNQLQAHLLPQRTCQAPELSLRLGQVHRHPSVLGTVPDCFPKGIWDAANYSMCETAVRAHICHDVTDQTFWMVPSVNALPGNLLCQEKAIKIQMCVYIRSLITHWPSSKQR